MPRDANVLQDLVNLTRLMAVTEGRQEIRIALIDGPVNTTLPDFAESRIENSFSQERAACDDTAAAACMHGTLVAGVLIGRRGCSAPAICPGCTLLLHPIFGKSGKNLEAGPQAPPESLAAAIVEAVNAGARIVNLSCGILHCSPRGESSLRDAVDFAARRGVIVVAAAGNQAAVGGTCITKNPWVIPVVSIDQAGRPTDESNLGASIGQRGLAAPGKNITSVSSTGVTTSFSGTSAACPFVSGAAALLWSEHPTVSGAQIRRALLGQSRPRSIVPPIMDAWAALERLEIEKDRRNSA